MIDDDADDREIFQAALQDLKVEIKYLEALDGKHALDMIADDQFTLPDFIFVDLNMPKVNGYEFLKTVRQMPAYQQAVIYMYSTSSLQSEREKCIREGATGFITKHSSFDALCRELEKLIV